jgi:pimeloyl-ACP methyl ester carboxylesterase
MSKTLAFLLVAATLAIAEEPRHGTITVSDGLKIHYMETGKGTPVVLIHGYTGSAEGNWFSNGVAAALAPRHRVVAIDCRGHGRSEKPHDPARYGARMWQDVIELMDALGIERAHVHGYSMGGGIVARLLANRPERFITAAFGGSGVPEVDAEWKAKTPPDKEGTDPLEAEARSKLQASPSRDEEALKAVRANMGLAQDSKPLDLKMLRIPVLAINGEYDKPNAKTARMTRELPNFKSVVLPGKSHLTAIMAGYIPKQYIETLVAFIDSNDRR